MSAQSHRQPRWATRPSTHQTWQPPHARPLRVRDRRLRPAGNRAGVPVKMHTLRSWREGLVQEAVGDCGPRWVRHPLLLPSPRPRHRKPAHHGSLSPRGPELPTTEPQAAPRSPSEQEPAGLQASPPPAAPRCTQLSALTLGTVVDVCGVAHEPCQPHRQEDRGLQSQTAGSPNQCPQPCE